MDSNELLLQKWHDCLDFIKDNVEPVVFARWFVEIVPLKYENQELSIQVQSHFVYEFIEENYLEVLQAAIFRTFGKECSLMYHVVADKEHNINVDVTSKRVTSSSYKETYSQNSNHPKQIDAPLVQDLDPMLNPDYSFMNFIEGVSNKLARTAGEAVAQNPVNSAFNPLFIYGASGVGKTHLVNAIGSKIKEDFPSKRVLYISAHLFYVQYVDAVRNNSTNDFIHFYQTIDVLIIDDIQEISTYTKTQNAFFHIFNHLHLNHKQLVMTSDRAPQELNGMEERLLTRFKWGLVAELERPDAELRRDILLSKTRRDGVKFPPEVIDFIADNTFDSVRELEGIIASLMAHSTIYNREIDLDLVRSVLFKTRTQQEKPITMESIINKVCDYYDVRTEDIQTKSRKHDIVQVRQVSMYLAKKYLELSTSKIGLHIGKRDHATVLHACNTVKDQLAVDKSFKQDLENIESSLRL